MIWSVNEIGKKYWKYFSKTEKTKLKGYYKEYKKCRDKVTERETTDWTVNVY